jgi:hypothetical protein
MAAAVSVTCSPAGDGYLCQVTVREGGSSSRHAVHVSRSDLARWAGGRTPEDLVKDSFEFLLRRESKESILREFDLSIIKRYFPDYDGAG